MASNNKSGSSGAKGGTSTPQDPDALARDIEATRADLAQTLDAIADRVSPKKVAKRSQEQVVVTAKEKAAVAKVVIAEKATQTRDLLVEKTGTARAVVSEKTGTARAVVTEKRGVVTEKLAARGGGPSLVKEPSVDPTLVTGPPVGADGLPPVTGVEVPGLAPATPLGSPSGSSTYVSAMPAVRTEVVAGAVVALAGLWLLWRRRR